MLTKRGVSLTLLLVLASSGCGARQTRDAGAATAAAGATITCVSLSVATGCWMETDESGEETLDCGATPEPEVVQSGLAGALVGSALMILGGILIGVGTPPDPKQNRSRLPPPRAPAPEGFVY